MERVSNLERRVGGLARTWSRPGLKGGRRSSVRRPPGQGRVQAPLTQWPFLVPGQGQEPVPVQAWKLQMPPASAEGVQASAAQRAARSRQRASDFHIFTSNLLHRGARTRAGEQMTAKAPAPRFFALPYVQQVPLGGGREPAKQVPPKREDLAKAWSRPGLKGRGRAGCEPSARSISLPPR